MQFLRTVFWVVIAVLAVIFAFNNWIDVSVHLWGDIGTVWKLPFLLFAVFLLGLLPPWILHRVTRWSMRRKLDTANRSLVETRAVHEVPVYNDSVVTSAQPTVPQTLL
jgi:multisubunit Na+/H+ antiporter MnhG subunit